MGTVLGRSRLAPNEVLYARGLGDGSLDPVEELLSRPRARVAGLVIDKVDKIVGKGIPEAGFYRVKGEMFLIQIVVINELANPEAIYPFAPFLTGQRRKEIRPFSMLMQKYLQEPANPRRRDLVEFSIKSEINLPEELEEVLAMIRQLAPEEKERMKEVLSNSPVAREWFDNAWKEGKTEGRLEGKTEAIFNYLRIKFGLEAGEWQEKIRRLTDTGALDRLLERLFTAESKEEAQAVIQETLAETTGFSPMQ